MNLTLTRFGYLDDCTLGWLQAGSLRLATMERPWINNPDGPGGKRRESCVPDGAYTVRPHTSQRFPNTYALVNHALGVYYQPFEIPELQPWGRSAILIHMGNRVQDVIGCIAVGMTHSLIGVERAVLRSAAALDALRKLLGQDNHVLDIRPFAGTQEAA